MIADTRDRRPADNDALTTRCLIGGAWVDADSGRTFDVTDPATDHLVARVPDAGVAETRRAIDAAASALPDWTTRPAHERSALLTRLALLMRRDRAHLASILTSEQGKPLEESAGEIDYAASFLDWAAGEAPRIMGEVIASHTPDKRILTTRRGVGVVAIITPWNFPSAMVTRKLGPALACGCTCVIKPAEQTPLSAIAIARLGAEAGLPAGVLNVITGRPEPIAQAMLDDARVRKLSFTGSTDVGRILVRQSAANLQRLSLELGGHAPFIVFDDADLDVAVRGAIAGKFRNAGQTCICPNRFYVQKAVYPRFASRLRDAMCELRIGRGTDPGVRIGPLINDDAVEKVERHVADARSRGARITLGGSRVAVQGCTDRFYAPTLIEDFTHDMLLAREETFGPVASLAPFDDEDQAIALANDSPFGLAAYVYTRDIGRAVRTGEALQAGVVGINDAAPSTAQAPFGGVKHSGYGREGGRHAMHDYTDIKYISLGF